GGAARLDHMHVDVLRDVAVRIAAGPDGVEAIAAVRIRAHPPAQPAMPRIRWRVDAGLVGLVGIDDDAWLRLANVVQDATRQRHRFARPTGRRNARVGFQHLRDAVEHGFATFAGVEHGNALDGECRLGDAQYDQHRQYGSDLVLHDALRKRPPNGRGDAVER